MYKLYIFLVFWFLTSVVFSQGTGTPNLVKNPSFEEHVKCPEKLGNIDTDVPYWHRSSKGTTDYFHSCSATLGVPKNFNGNQSSQFGEAYAGLYMQAPNNYREYLQGELLGPLEAAKDYTISFHISLADISKFAVRDIGILFSAERMLEDTKKAHKQYRYSQDSQSYNFVEVRNRSYFSNKNGWSKVSAVFTANGNEKYLTIGNFRADANSSIQQLKGGKNAAYYYLDMVSVIKVTPDIPDDRLLVNTFYPLKNIVFSHDVYELDKEAEEELNALLKTLKADSSLYVTIHAHTDNTGSVYYNKKLSINRAKAIADYLRDSGLEKERIRWVGHGADRPIAENASDTGRQKNRRAEFVISRNRFQEYGTMAETIFEYE